MPSVLIPLQSPYDEALSDIAITATRNGFSAEATTMTISDLRREKPLGILHIDGHHFVGLVGYDRHTLHIAETGYAGPPQIQRWSDGDLMARWDGVILVIRPGKQNGDERERNAAATAEQNRAATRTAAASSDTFPR